MTNVQIQKQNGVYLGFVVSGHSGYGSQGNDIVCSAISSLSQMVCVGVENVLNLKPIIKINENKAYLSCMLPKNMEQENNNKVQFLFETFEKSVQLLLLGDKNFKKYINLEVKNEIY